MSDHPDIRSELARAEARLAEIEAEHVALRATIDSLRAAAVARPAPAISVSVPAATQAVPTTQSEKVALFGAMFRGRTDVYPRRWENRRTGKAGYSPHCANEWQRGVCGKPKVKCGECPARAFIPVTDRILLDHLQGTIVAGVYPLLEGDRCRFVAADFDGDAWQEDVGVFAETAHDVGLPVAVERSRSGNGAHTWFFFEDEVPATAARQMASYVLTEAMSRRSSIGMTSYDRLFPNQDTVPRGGFGNLIALPLQWESRQKGNTLFLDDAFEPFADQWAFLARLPRIPAETASSLAREALRRGRVLGVRFAPVEDDGEPWSRRPSGARPRDAIAGPLPDALHVILGQRAFVDRQGLPPALATEIRRLASFQNPVFFEKQASAARGEDRGADLRLRRHRRARAVEDVPEAAARVPRAGLRARRGARRTVAAARAHHRLRARCDSRRGPRRWTRRSRLTAARSCSSCRRSRGEKSEGVGHAPRGSNERRRDERADLVRLAEPGVAPGRIHVDHGGEVLPRVPGARVGRDEPLLHGFGEHRLHGVGDVLCYCGGRVRSTGEHVILEFRSEEEGADWIDEGDGPGALSALLPVRAELAGGDHRALYLGWLLRVQGGEVDGADEEPPCPPGLRSLSAPLVGDARVPPDRP